MNSDTIDTVSENRHILVIDDNLAIHEDFRKILASPNVPNELDRARVSLFGETPVSAYNESFQVDFADQGEAGFRMVEQAIHSGVPYAVAFVDMRMPPGWDGLQTIEHIWKADSEIQVVICTAFSDHPWQQIAQRLGRTDRLLILRKPFDTVEVEQLAVSLTRKWELAQNVAARTAELSSRNEQLQQINQQLTQFLEELRRAKDVVNGANST